MDLSPLSGFPEVRVALGAGRLTAVLLHSSRDKSFHPFHKEQRYNTGHKQPTLGIAVSGLPRCNCNLMCKHEVYFVTEDINLQSCTPWRLGRGQGNQPPDACSPEWVPVPPATEVPLPLCSLHPEGLWRHSPSQPQSCKHTDLI